MKLLGRFGILVCVFVAVGCSAPIPNSPSPPPPRPAPPAVPSSASLAIEDVYVVMHSNPFRLDLRFLLRETGGVSGASLQTIFVGDGRGGGDMTAVDCWGVTLRVPPGDALDTFYTKAGWDWLGYCAPAYGTAVDTPNLKAPVTVNVTFLDDAGRTGFLDFRGEARVIVDP